MLDQHSFDWISDSERQQSFDGDVVKLLVSNKDKVCQCLDPVNGLVDELVVQQVLTASEGDRILSIKTGYDGMSRELVEILLCKPDLAADKFLSALSATKQEHVESLLGGKTREAPISEEYRRNIVNAMEELSQTTNPSHGLLQKLSKVGAFTERDVDSIMSKSSYTAMSLEIFDLILRKPKSAFNELVETLIGTDQEHVVYILTGKGKEPTLSRVRCKVLVKMREEIVAKVEPKYESLVAGLIEKGLLNDVDLLRIDVKETREEKTAVLIDAIARKHHSAFGKLIQAFKDVSQLQIAHDLEGLEVRGVLRAEYYFGSLYGEDFCIVMRKLKELVNGTRPCCYTDAITCLTEQHSFAVSDISDGRTNEDRIRVGFRCFTSKSLQNLKRLYADGTLSELFTKLVSPKCDGELPGFKSLTLCIADEEFDKCADGFRCSEKLKQSLQLVAIGEEQITQELKSEVLKQLPLELLELSLLRTFAAIFTGRYKINYKTHEAIRLAYCTLAAVSHNWWQTMNGGPQSPTGHWFKHELRRVLNNVCRPYSATPRLQCTLSIAEMTCVARCDNKLFVACYCSDTIRELGPDNEPLTSIRLPGMQDPCHIVSCSDSRQLYVADEHDEERGCVWRVSLDSYKVVKWLPKTGSASSSAFYRARLSVTSRRLVVTTRGSNKLLLYDADGVELKNISFPYTDRLQHAVETSRGTFIGAFVDSRAWENRSTIKEIDFEGQVMRVYSDLNQLVEPDYLFTDSDGRVIVADNRKGRVLLLNSRLELERILLDMEQRRLISGHLTFHFAQQSGPLVVVNHRPFSDQAQIFNF